MSNPGKRRCWRRSARGRTGLFPFRWRPLHWDLDPRTLMDSMRMTSWAPAAALCGVLLCACAGGPAPRGPAPADLPALEAAQQQRPRDAGLLTRLGIAYYDGRQYARARDVLNSALTITAQNYAARVYLGLAYEGLGQLDSARVSFNAAAGQARNAAQRGEIENHLTLLTRKELRESARRAIAQESALSTTPPAQNAIAVFPFRYVGSDPELAPLGRGLTHLMITDLGKLPRITLLERERVQALVEELALNESGRADPATGARSGRLLRAGRVIQGSLQDVVGKTDLRLDAAVVDATDASVVATGEASDQLQQLFALEKQVLFRLLDQMGMTLTPAERRALSERPTADLQAFLAFSRGLEAEDRGDFAAAEAGYSAAVARDPNFRQARERRTAAQRSAQAMVLPPQVLAGITPGGDLGPSGPDGSGGGGGSPSAGPTGHGPILRTGVLVTVPTIGSALNTRISGGNGPVSRQPAERPPIQEVLNTDDALNAGGLTGTVIIIITRP
jgi:TolB-like protein